ARGGGAPPAATLSEKDAVAAAGRDAGISAAGDAARRVRLVAVPTADGVRSAYQVTLIDASGGEPKAVTSHLDARTGKALVRANLVGHAGRAPRRTAVPATPSSVTSSRNARQSNRFITTPACLIVVAAAPST